MLTLRHALLVPVLAAGMQFQQLHAKQWCTNGDFVGAYGLAASGQIIVPPDTPVTGPFARAGLFVSDGAGTIRVRTRASYNGLIFAEPFQGSYTVNPDCTIVFNAVVPDPINLPGTFAGVLSDDNHEVAFMLTNPPGTTIGGVLRRTDRKWCSAGDLNGAFQIDLQGSTVQPAASKGPYHRVGRVVTDGAGNFAASTNVSYGGQVVSENVAGIYTVDSDCIATFQFSLPVASCGTQPVTWTGPIVDKGSAVFVLQTQPAGAAIIGKLTAQ